MNGAIVSPHLDTIHAGRTIPSNAVFRYIAA